MTTRLLNTPQKSTGPKNPVEWHRLMVQAIERAERTGSRHLPGLRQALVTGNAELTLRRMGILGVTDIGREFPDST